MPFDLTGARQAGYSDKEIASFLSEKHPEFDVSGAMQAGYSLDEINKQLEGGTEKPAPAEVPYGGTTSISSMGQQDKTLLGKLLDLGGIEKPPLPESEKAKALVELQAKAEGVPLNQYREGPQEIEQLAKGYVDGITLGLLDTIKREATGSGLGYEPSSPSQLITSGAGELAGFLGSVGGRTAIAVPAKLAGKIPAATTKSAALLRQILTSGAGLGLGSGIQSLGESLKQKTIKGALGTEGKAVLGGAATGAIFGGAGAIPNRLLRLAAGIAGLEGLRASGGQSLLSEKKPLAQKVYDIGLDLFFLWNHHGPEYIKKIETAVDNKDSGEVERLLKFGREKEAEMKVVPEPERGKGKAVEDLLKQLKVKIDTTPNQKQKELLALIAREKEANRPVEPQSKVKYTPTEIETIKAKQRQDALIKELKAKARAKKLLFGREQEARMAVKPEIGRGAGKTVEGLLKEIGVEPKKIEELKNAKRLRENERQVQEGGVERQGGEAKSSPDLEQQTPQEPGYEEKAQIKGKTLPEPKKPQETPLTKPEGEKPLVIDEESYLAQHGASRQGFGEAALHKNIKGPEKDRAIKAMLEKDRTLQEKRDELRTEYAKKVAAGEIRPPAGTERLIETAKGNPDNESVRAARRLLKKKGIEWEAQTSPKPEGTTQAEKQPWEMMTREFTNHYFRKTKRIDIAKSIFKKEDQALASAKKAVEAIKRFAKNNDIQTASYKKIRKLFEDAGLIIERKGHGNSYGEPADHRIEIAAGSFIDSIFHEAGHSLLERKGGKHHWERMRAGTEWSHDFLGQSSAKDPGYLYRQTERYANLFDAYMTRNAWLKKKAPGLYAKIERLLDEHIPLVALLRETRKTQIPHPNYLELPKWIHRRVVQQALSEGKPVPRNVLEEYKGEPWADKALQKPEGEKPLVIDEESYLAQHGASRQGFEDRQSASEKQPSPKLQIGEKRVGESSINKWYSAVANTVKDMKFKSMPSKNLAARLKKTPGVKQTELDWIGLEDWLKNKPKVTKQEVLDFIDTNNVQIKEVVKGAPFDPIPKKRFEGYYDTDGIFNREGVRFDGEKLTFDGENEIYLTKDTKNVYDGDGYYWVLVNDELHQYAEKPSLQGEYGEAETAAATERVTRFNQYQEPGGENYREILLTMPETRFPIEKKIYQQEDGKYYITGLIFPFKTKKLAQDYINKVYKGKLRAAHNFTDSHWEEPNVLVHARVNDRMDTQGKKILFIEEIQSDWAQKGRKKGFSGTQEGAKKYFGIPDDRWANMSEQEKNSYVEEMGRMGVPNMPYKHTQQWTELALKHLVRYAAENGYDAIAWTPGDIQAARYDLSKQVDSVRIARRANDRFDLYVKKDGNVILSKNKITREELSDTIGKDLTDKAVKDLTVLGEDKEYSGLDLKIGGEGMKAFYDKIVPNIANKFFNKAKWGNAKVEKIKILTKEAWSLPITPKMRSKALTEGMPLFQKKKMALVQGTEIKALSDLRNNPVLKTANITEHPDGRLSVHWKNGKGFEILRVSEINPDEVTLEVANGKVIKGQFEGGQKQRITLSRFADQTTLPHEVHHWIEDNGLLNETEIAALDSAAKKRFGKGGEESRAQFVGEQLKQRSVKGQLGAIIQKIADFLDAIHSYARKMFGKKPTAGEVVRGIEKGKVQGHEAAKVNRFAVSRKYSLKEAIKKVTDYNTGTFSPDNPDIRYQTGPKIKAENVASKEKLSKILKSEKGGVEVTGRGGIEALQKKAGATMKAIKEIKDTLSQAGTTARIYITPAHGGELAKELAARHRQSFGKIYGKMITLEDSVKKVRSSIDKIKPAEIKEAKYLYETGKTDKIKNPVLRSYFKDVHKPLMKDALSIINETKEALGQDVISGLPDYLSHLYKNNKHASKVLHEILTADRATEGGSFLKKRIIPTEKQAEEYGLKPRYLNPVDTALHHYNTVLRWSEKMKNYKMLKDEGFIKFFRVGKKGDLLKAKHPDWKPLKDSAFTVLFPTEKGVVVAGKYYAPPDVANLMNNLASESVLRKIPGFKQFRESQNLINMINLGISTFHGLFSAVINGANYLGMALSDVSAGELRHAGKNFAKAALYPVQSAADIYKGYKDIKQFKAGKLIDPYTKAYVRDGGKLGLDPIYEVMSTRPSRIIRQAIAQGGIKGSAKAATTLPLAVIDTLAAPIMRIQVPALKTTAYKLLMQAEMRRLKIDQPFEEFVKTKKGRDISQYITDRVEDRFGQMNYDNLFWHKTTKDALMSTFRSVGWNLGDTRELTGAADLGKAMKILAKGDFKGANKALTQKVFFIAAVPLITAYTGSIIYYLMHGTPPKTWKDATYPTTLDGTRLSIPSYYRDYVAMLKQGPVKTLAHKMHPSWSLLYDLKTGEDYWGDAYMDKDDPWYIQLKDYATHSVEVISPISVQNYLKNEGIAKYSGFTGLTKAPKYVDETPAQKFISERYTKVTGGVKRTKQQALAAKFKSKIRKQYDKTGELPKAMLKEALQKGYFKSYSSIARFEHTLGVPGFARAFAALPIKDQVEALKLAKDKKEYDLLWKHAKPQTRWKLKQGVNQ